jgi:hypothetical protein
MTAALPHIFRWIFTVLTGIAALAALAICLALLRDPHLPPGTHFGPFTWDFAGQPATIVLRPTDGDSDLTVNALKGNLILSVSKAGGLIEVLKHYGMPVALINMISLAALFELLRRLFRNVGRGESFTRQTVGLVQIIGGGLITFSVIASTAEHWFMHAAFAYIADHSVLTISGTAIRFPSPRDVTLPGFHFSGPIFWSGWLVLALSEVFRQGLALKSENDLTV